MRIGRTLIRHLIEQARGNFSILADDVRDWVWNPGGREGVRFVIEWLFRRIVNAVFINRFVFWITEQGEVECPRIVRLIRVVNHLARVVVRIQADRQNFDVFLFFG